MKKLRILSFLLAMVMVASCVFALAACKKKPNEPGGTPGGTPADTTKYTVSFDVGSEAAAAGVSTPANQKIAKGGKVVRPVNDAWEGHSLSNWLYNGAAWDFSKDTVQSDMTLTAEWKVVVVDEKYEASLTWGVEGHLYVHYLRGAHDATEEGTTNKENAAPNYSEQIESAVYGDWGLWVWEKVPVNGEGRSFYPMKIDESGAIYDIDLTATYNDAGWNGDTKQSKGLTITYANTTQIGFQLYQQSSRVGGGFWVNDGGDVFLDLVDAKIDGRNGLHWFVSQNAVPNGTPQFTGEAVDDPFAGIPEGSAVSKRDVVSNFGNNSTYTQQPVAEGWEENSVGYQIFIASFADSDGDGMGDIRGIINKLDYLDDLGVDTLWLTPFQTSNSYHGYDIMDYFSVDPRFGTLDDYRELLYKAHQRGMKVLLDFVLNHTSQSNPWFAKSQNLVKETVTLPDGTQKEIDYRNFYNWQNEEYVSAITDPVAKAQWYKDPNGYYFYSSFGSSMPELNFDYQATRDAILEVALYWMSFGLDGFRLDAVKHIYMYNENDEHSGWIVKDGGYSFDMNKNAHFFMEFNAKLKSTYPNALLLGENFNGNPANLAGLYGGLDSQFNFNWYYDTTTNLSKMGNSGDGATVIMQQYAAAQFDFSRFRTDYIDGVFTSNHDVQRARDKLFSTDVGVPRTAKAGDTAWNLSENMAKMYAALSLTVPGITWIYNGDELGMFGTKTNNPAGDGSGHEDRWYRQPMKWSKEREGSSFNCYYLMGFNNYHIEWDALNAQLDGVAEQATDSNSIYNLYKDIIAIRRANPVLARGTVVNRTTSGGLICFSVKDADHEILVYINATQKAQTASYTVPTGAELLYGNAGSSIGAMSISIYKVK